MWTPATRRQHNRESLRYETDLTDQEWNLIAPMLPAAAKTGRPRGWPLREIMNAIFYVMRGGIGWRLLPSDFPPRSTVFRWFRRFRDECLFEKINHKLLPLFDIHVGLAAHAGIAAVFTLLSLMRSYLVRRLFDHMAWQRREDERLRRQRLERRLARGS